MHPGSEPELRDEDAAALREAAPGDDPIAAQARAAIEASLFGVAATPAPAELQRVGRYEIEGKLGAGGMGVVYRAYDPELDRHVAVKLVRSDTAGDELARQRMIREARAMARLAHPNVIHVYDVGTVDDQVFVAMELVDGVSLGAWLMAGARPWEAVLERFVAAGEGLLAAHRAGLIHRDFKPENVLVAGDGRVRVLDFGLARSALEAPRGAEAAASGDDGATVEAGEGASMSEPTTLREAGGLGGSLTRTGALLGTPRYMARELCLGRPADARSDLFAFCVALYEGIYGRSPFPGETVTGYLEAVVNGELREPPADSAAPPWLWPVLGRGLAGDPEDRYPDMAALLDALRGPPRGAASPWRARGLALVAGLGAAGLVAALAWGLGPRGEGASAAGASAAGLAPAEAGPPVDAARALAAEAGETSGAAVSGATEAGEANDTDARGTDAASGASTGAEAGGAAASGEAAGAAAAGETSGVAAVKTSPRRRDWCYMDEDRYLLLRRMPRRRAHIRDRDGRCYACRVESRAARVQRFQPDDCAHYQVCGRVADGECE
ncbi:MAG: serine/threonine-protein kinase [Nannocystaceae bacterium]